MKDTQFLEQKKQQEILDRWNSIPDQQKFDVFMLAAQGNASAMSQIPDNARIPIRVASDFTGGKHEYVRQGTYGYTSDQINKAMKNFPALSTTQLESYITGESYANADPMYAERGTALHEFVQDVESGHIKNDSDVHTWIRNKMRILNGPYRSLGQAFPNSSPSVDYADKNILKFWKDYNHLKQSKTDEFGNKVLTEKPDMERPFAFVQKIGNKFVQVNGQYDQLRLASGNLNDIKSSKRPVSGYGFQLNTYARGIQASSRGHKAPTSMTISDIPYGRSPIYHPSFSKVSMLDEDVYNTLLRNAVSLYDLSAKGKQDSDEAKAIAKINKDIIDKTNLGLQTSYDEERGQPFQLKDETGKLLYVDKSGKEIALPQNKKPSVNLKPKMSSPFSNVYVGGVNVSSVLSGKAGIEAQEINRMLRNLENGANTYKIAGKIVPFGSTKVNPDIQSRIPGIDSIPYVQSVVEARKHPSLTGAAASAAEAYNDPYEWYTVKAREYDTANDRAYGEEADPLRDAQYDVEGTTDTSFAAQELKTDLDTILNMRDEDLKKAALSDRIGVIHGIVDPKTKEEEDFDIFSGLSSNRGLLVDEDEQSLTTMEDRRDAIQVAAASVAQRLDKLGVPRKNILSFVSRMFSSAGIRMYTSETSEVAGARARKALLSAQHFGRSLTKKKLLAMKGTPLGGELALGKLLSNQKGLVSSKGKINTKKLSEIAGTASKLVQSINESSPDYESSEAEGKRLFGDYYPTIKYLSRLNDWNSRDIATTGMTQQKAMEAFGASFVGNKGSKDKDFMAKSFDTLGGHSISDLLNAGVAQSSIEWVPYSYKDENGKPKTGFNPYLPEELAPSGWDMSIPKRSTPEILKEASKSQGVSWFGKSYDGSPFITGERSDDSLTPSPKDIGVGTPSVPSKEENKTENGSNVPSTSTSIAGSGDISINASSVTISSQTPIQVLLPENALNGIGGVGGGSDGGWQKKTRNASASSTEDEKIKLTPEQRSAISDYRSIIRDQSSYRNEYLDIQKMLASDRRVNTDYRTRRSYQERAAEIKQLYQERTQDAKDWEATYGKDAKSNSLMKEAVSQTLQNAGFVNTRKDAQRLTKENGATTLFDNLKTSFHGLLNQFVQFGLAYRVLGMVRQGIQNVVTVATQLDKAMTNIRIVTGDSREEAVKYMKSLSGLAMQLGVTTTEVAQAADSWLRQGYSIADTNTLITDSIHLAVEGGISAAESMSDLTSIMKGFHLSVNEAASAVDKLVKVDQIASVSAGGISQSLQQVSNVAHNAGVSLNETIGMVSVIGEATQREPSSVGQALRTMIARFSNVKAGVYGTMNVDSDNAEATENVNDIEKVLRKVGIQIRSSQLDFRSFSDVLGDVADKWDTLDGVSKRALASSMAGIRQQEQFYALMDNWARYQQLTEAAADSAGTAEKKYLSYTEQLEAAQKRLQAAWESVTQNADFNQWLTWLNNGLAWLVDNLPIILRYTLRILSTLNAYKIPSWLSSFGSLFGGRSGSYSRQFSNYLAGGNRGYNESLSLLGLPGSGKAGGGLLGKELFGDSGTQIKTGADVMMGAAEKMDSAANKMAGSAGSGTLLVDKNGRTISAKPGTLSAGARNPNADQVFDEAGYFYNGKSYWKEERDASGRTTGFKSVNGQTLNYDPRWAGTADAAQTGAGIIYDKQYGQYFQRNDDGTFSNLDGAVVGDKNLAKRLRKSYDKTMPNKAWETKEARAATTAQIGVAAISAAMTAPTSGKWQNSITGNWEDRELSSNMQTTSRIVSGAAAGAGAALGSIAGPLGTAIGGSLGGAVADLIDTLVLPKIDAEVNILKDIAETGEKGLTVMSNIKSSVTTLSDLSEKSLDSTSYGQAVSAKNSILQQLLSSGSDEARGVFEKYLAQEDVYGGTSGNETLSDVMNAYLNGDAATRSKIANALSVAQRRTSSNEYIKSQAENIRDLESRSKTQNLGQEMGWSTLALLGGGTGQLPAQISAWTQWGTGQRQGGTNDALVSAYAEAAKEAGVSDKLKIGSSKNWYQGLASFFGVNVSDTTIDTSAMTTEERLEMYEKIRDKAQEENNSTLLNSVSDIIDNLEAIKEKQEEIYDEVNAQNADAAVLAAQSSNGTSVTSMTAMQLKSLGPDKIREMVAEELAKSGGIAGHDIWVNGEGSALTTYAKNLIDTSLKQYSSIYGIVTGESYRLSEALGLPDSETKTEMMKSFASAIGTTLDKLSDYASKYGDLTLGDFLSTPTDLRTNLESYAKMISEIGSSTGMTNETMESIISKYPDLIQYLGDSSELVEKLMEKMGQTSDLYSSGTMSSVLGSSSVFKMLKDAIQSSDKGLYSDLENNSVFGNASTLNDIMTWLGGGSDLAKKVQEYINKVLNFNVDVKENQTVLNEVISYQTKLMDKQISNLNDQKDALSKINQQREYQNKLIEAQLKLENAQKQKHLVYRAGIGFVEESDQAAIKEAQDNLDSIDVEKQQDLLQTEIDQLTAEKKLLTDLADDEELKNLKTIYDEWAQSNGTINDAQITIIGKITDLYAKLTSLNVANAVTQGAKTSAENSAQLKTKMDNAWNAYQSNKTNANLQAWQEAAKAYINSGAGYSTNNMDTEQQKAYAKEVVSSATYTFAGHKGVTGNTLVDSEEDAANWLKDAQDGKSGITVYSLKNGEGRTISASTASLYTGLREFALALATDEGGPIALKIGDNWVAYTGSDLKRLSVSDDSSATAFSYKAAALGSYGLPGGQTLLNERGTEAIVTPYGTLTSLPSGTGVVPADLTQKLYDLSMVSPSILNALGAYKTGAGVAVSGIGGSSTDESLNINSLTMNVTAGSDFDADAFAEQLKQQAALTKRNH